MNAYKSGGYGTEQQGQWYYIVPGETSYLTGYLINPYRRDDHSCSASKYPQPHDFDGLWSQTYGIYYQLYTNRALYGNSAVYGNEAKTVKEFVFGLNSGNGVSLPCARDLYAGGLATYMTDPDWPTLDAVSGFPSGWFDDSKTYDIKVSAHDHGLGVQNIHLDVDNGTQVSLGNDCYGTHDSPCQRDRSGTIKFSADNPKEGKSKITPVAIDPVAHSTTGTPVWVYVDSTPPKIALSGQLAKATEEENGDKEDPEEWDELSLPVYNLQIGAEDGQKGSDLSIRSGVKDIEVFLDEREESEPVPWEAQGCSGPEYSCSMSEIYTLRLAGLAAGKHTLKVFAVDQMGHKSERDIEFEYIPATGIKDEYVMQHFPLPDGEGNEDEEEHPRRPELAVNVMNGNLVYRQRDIDVEGPSVDLELERFYNSQLPESENTEWGDGWTLGQTPRLEPEETKESEAPAKASMVRTSGILERAVALPTKSEESRFDAKLQATVTKLPGGGYEVADESGETGMAQTFDEAGKVKELRTGGYAKVDYAYEEGKLDEIAVDDPGSTTNISSVAQPPFQKRGPVASYSFNEGTGETAHDDSGNGHDGTVHGAEWTEDGKYGGALNFEGGGNRVVVPDSKQLDFTGAFTIEAWVRQWGRRPWESIISKAESKKPNYGYLLYAGNEEGETGPSAWIADKEGSQTSVEDEEELPEEAWSHLAVASDGEELRIYVDGELIATEAALTPRITEAPLRIGGNESWWEYFDGTIDEVRLYDRALDAGEIEEDRDIPIEPQPYQGQGPVAAYSFGEGSGGVAHDDSGNGHDGTVHGAEWTEAGRYGGALDFGEGDWVSLADSSSLNFAEGFTLEAWVQLDEQRPWAPLISKIEPEEPDISYLFYAGNEEEGPSGWVADSELNIAGVQGAETLPLNAWSHVTLTSDDEYLRLYVGGELIATEAALPAKTTESELRIGGEQWGEYFDGTIDEVRLYDRALGAEKIKEDEATPINGASQEPIAAYPFDEGSSEIVHDYVGAHDGTVHGAEWREEGRYGGSLHFDGEEDLVTIPSAKDLAFTEAFTLEAWVRPDEANEWSAVFTKESPSQISYQLHAEGEHEAPVGYVTGGEGEAEVEGSSPIPAGKWSHLALTSNGKQLRLYSNGELVDTSSSLNPASGEGPLQVGGDLLWEEDFFKGDIDEIRLYDRALGAEEIEEDEATPIVNPAPEAEPQEDDPAVDVSTEAGLVGSVEGEGAGETSYEHEGELLTAVDSPKGETSYEYDAEGRMTKVSLPNKTWGAIEYREDGRVKAVTVSVEGTEAKTTHFEYEDEREDESRRTIVVPPDAPAVTYDIGGDGSVLRWWNAETPPSFFKLSGSLYAAKETSEAIKSGLYNLSVEGYSEEGVEHIEILGDDNTLLSEKTCEQDYEEPGIECVYEEDEWVVDTENLSPGIHYFEILLTDRKEGTAAERLWVNIPQPPPPPPDGAAVRPTYSEILNFREEFGLDVVDPVETESELNNRIFNLINAWTEEDPVARASAERWGVPLRAHDVAELEYREHYVETDGSAIDAWAEATYPATYAGYYVDQAAGGTIHVGFTQKQSTSYSDLMTHLTLMAPDRAVPYPYVPTSTRGALANTEREVATAWETNNDLAGTVTEVGLDEATNTVIVGATNVTLAEHVLKDEVSGQNLAVTLQDAWTPMSARFRTTGRLLAGDNILNVHGACTAGFGAYEDRREKQTGEMTRAKFLLTAGHCFSLEAYVHRSLYMDFSHVEDWTGVGEVTRSAFETQGEFYETDGEAIRLRGDGLADEPRDVPNAMR